MQQVMGCPNCGSPIALGQQFCGTCGAKLAAGCPNCGAGVAPGARFCGNCGVQLAGGIQQPTGMQPEIQPPPKGAKGAVTWFVSIILAVVVAGLVFLYFSPDYNMYLIRSESMKPAINMGDMIVTGSLNGEVKPGMIVTYELGNELVTHRVLSVDGNTLATKGDAAEDPDPRPVAISQVSGVYLFKIPYIGYLSSFMRTKVGWFSVVIVPAMLLVALIVKEIVKEAIKGSKRQSSSKGGGA